ncbi:hypothetical protein O7615_08515 [Micromonospora sp. WMMD1082]|nr:hypothetical protein [Micromonospora sp. WMMD1082]MDG4793920.1 hypothetical protein [Micromonospora sp. WMMD1082]
MRVHRTDLVSFAFGLLFLALAAWWLLAQVLGLVVPPVGWFLAGGLILVGGLGLIGALRSSRHSSTPATPDSTPAAPDAPGDTNPEPTDPEPTGAAGAETATATTPESTTGTDADEARTLDLFAGDELPPPGRGPAA